MINLKGKKNGDKRKYRKSIYLLVFFSILSIVVISSYLIFSQVQRYTIQKQNQINKVIASQIQFSLKLKNESIQDLCRYLFYNSDAAYVMDTHKSINDEYEFVEISNKIAQLKSSVLTINPYIYSVVIYNAYNDLYYNTYSGILFKDLKLLDLIQEYKVLPLNKPIYREIILTERLSATDKFINVLTYPIYEMFEDSKKTLFVNINPQWFFDSINEFNKTNNQSTGISGEFFIIDSKDNIIREIQSDDTVINRIKTIYTDEIEKMILRGEKEGHLSYFADAEELLITYSYIEDMDWVLINATPYKIAFREANKMLRDILITIIFFILISFIVAFIVSYKIYNPIKKLLERTRINTGRMDSSTQFDEIAYIENIYSKSIEVLKESMKEKNNNENILKNYYFKNMLLNNTISKEEVERFAQDYGIDVENTYTSVCVLRIDESGESSESFLNDDYLLKFVICNIINELVGEEYLNEAISIQTDIIALIINTKDYSEEFYTEIKHYIKNAQQYISTHFRVSFSAALSPITLGKVNLSKNYQKALENINYRYLHGNMCFILPKDVEENMQNKSWNYSFEEEKKFIESLKLGDISKAEEILGLMFEKITTQNFNNIQLSVNHIINTLKITLTEIEDMKFMKNNINLDQLLNFNNLTNQTIDILYKRMIDVINTVLKYEKTDNVKRTIIVETVKELVQFSYSDLTFSSQKIADTLKMSRPYILRVFKEETGESLSSFIEDFRLNKAADLLISTNHNVTEIVNEIGMQNESNFYKRFKAKYALTPKEYSFKYSRGR